MKHGFYDLLFANEFMTNTQTYCGSFWACLLCLQELSKPGFSDKKRLFAFNSVSSGLVVLVFRAPKASHQCDLEVLKLGDSYYTKNKPASSAGTVTQIIAHLSHFPFAYEIH